MDYETSTYGCFSKGLAHPDRIVRDTCLSYLKNQPVKTLRLLKGPLFVKARKSGGTIRAPVAVVRNIRSAACDLLRKVIACSSF